MVGAAIRETMDAISMKVNTPAEQSAGQALTNRRMVARGLRYYACCLFGLAVFASAQKHIAANTAADRKGAALFSQDCSACHGTDGRGGERAPNIATQHDIVSRSDAQLYEIIDKGILSAGMPGFSYLGGENIRDIVAHLRQLQGIGSRSHVSLPGDPRAGKDIFFAAGSCSSCHSIRGRGGFLGDDLTGYARGRSVASIQQAIGHLDEPANGKGLVTIQTIDGMTYSGAVRAQDNFDVILQSEDGAYQNISRDQVKHMGRSERSVKLQEYGKSLDRTQMNNLVSYLIQVAGSGASEPAKTKSAK
jgi:cytochrome c oxidase cbb3-type subunit III